MLRNFLLWRERENFTSRAPSKDYFNILLVASICGIRALTRYKQKLSLYSAPPHSLTLGTVQRVILFLYKLSLQYSGILVIFSVFYNHHCYQLSQTLELVFPPPQNKITVPLKFSAVFHQLKVKNSVSDNQKISVIDVSWSKKAKNTSFQTP